jgi:hypothetical protein
MRKHHSLTSTQVRAEIFPDGAPIWCRYLRVQQALEFYPLKRAKLYEKLATGDIKSFCLKEKGALKGLRLIDRDSYDAYLERAAKAALEEGGTRTSLPVAGLEKQEASVAA